MFREIKVLKKLNYNSAGNECELPTEADIRAMRVNYFRRNVNKQYIFGTPLAHQASTRHPARMLFWG